MESLGLEWFQEWTLHTHYSLQMQTMQYADPHHDDLVRYISRPA